MKAIVFAVLLMGPVSVYALGTDVKATIENSEQFKTIQQRYTNLGGSLKCDGYQVAAHTDLKATLPGYSMFAESVIASCKADPNDGGDAFNTKLLAFVTTVVNEDMSQDVEVISVNTVTPPQPD